jgi:hypothetical protein
VQGIEAGPDQQIQNEQRAELIEAASELIGRAAAQAEQREAAAEIPEQSRAKGVELFQRARSQLRILRNRSMSFSCAAARASSASACA